MSGPTLKILRMVVSITILAVLTTALATAAVQWPAVARFIAEVQIFPAVMSFSLLTFVVWLLVTLVFGRVYCSSMCPLGTLQDCFARLPRMSRSMRRRRPYRWRRPVYRLQYAVLVVVMVCLMAGLMFVAELLDPYTVYADMVALCSWPVTRVVVMSVSGAAVTAVLMLAVALVSARNGRLICNTMCPVGTTLGFVSRYALFQIDIDSDRCTHCGECEAVCKASCINLKENTVDGTRCVNCFNCLCHCPNDAIHYTAQRKQLSDTLMQRIGPTADTITETSEHETIS